MAWDVVRDFQYTQSGGGTTEVEVDVYLATDISFYKGATSAFTNMPAAVTELFSAVNRRKYFNLTGYTTATIYCGGTVSGFAGAKLACQYSLDDGSNWNYLDNTSGPFTLCDSMSTATAPQVGSAVNIHADAKTDVLLRIVGLDGNGSVDPSFSHIGVMLT